MFICLTSKPQQGVADVLIFLSFSITFSNGCVHIFPEGSDRLYECVPGLLGGISDKMI